MLIIETWPIYGITVTERSFVLGILRQEKRIYAKMLVLKIAGHVLPTEIADQIEDHLFSKLWESTSKSWERTDERWRGRHPSLYWERYVSESALAAWCKLAEQLGLTLAARQGPHDNLPSFAQPLSPYLVHIARPGPYSHGALSLAGPEALHARVGNGLCCIAQDSVRGVCHARYMLPKKDYVQGGGRLDQFFECGGLEEAIEGWDDEAARLVVEILGLEVVRAGKDDGRDPMRPSLKFVQSFAPESGNCLGDPGRSR